MIEQRVTLRYGAQQIPAIVQAVQCDTGRDVIFELADYEIPAGATANYYIDKPDGNAVYNSAEVISSTEILAHLTEQALAAPGRNNGQVRILADGEVITSFDFVLEVEAFRGILRLQSETEVNIFDEALQTAAENAIQEILDQTPVVTGMQNSIAPTYSSSSTYAVGDYVMYNAQLYRCVTAITTAETWTAAHWTQVPLANDANDLKSALTESIDYANSNAPVPISFSTKNVVKGVFNAQGQYASNSSYIVTKKVFDISEFDIINISVDSGYSYNVAFYNTPNESSFVSIMSSSWITLSRDYIPSGKYMRIQVRYNSGTADVGDISHISITGYNSNACKQLIFDNFGEAVNDGDYYIETYKDFVQGVLINGVLSANDSYIAMNKFVPVADVRTIHLNVASGYRAWIICYDSSKAFMFASQRMDGAAKFDIDVSSVAYIKVQISSVAENPRSGAGTNAIITATKKDSSIASQNIGVQNIFVQGAIVNGAISSASSRIAVQEFIDISNYGLLGINVKNGYYFALVLYSSASDTSVKYATPWMYSNNKEIAFDVSKYSYMRMTIRSSTNANITPDNGIQVTKVRGILTEYAYQYGISEEIETKRTYEGDRVSVNPTLDFYNTLPASAFSTDYPFTSYFQQGAAIHNGYVFMFRHHGACSVFDLNTMSLVDEFEISSITSDLPHCDNASFSKEYPSGNTSFPYCYVSRTSYPSETPDISFDDRNACYVFNITTSGATLVQTIKFDNSGSMPFAYGSADWVVDAERGRLIAYHQGASHGDSNAPWIFKEFAIPAIGESVVQLTSSDILDEWRFDNVAWGHNFGICQGLDVTDRYIFAPCSNPTINKEALVVLDKYEHRMIACSEWSKDITDELQAASTYRGALYLISEGARIDKLIFN